MPGLSTLTSSRLLAGGMLLIAASFFLSPVFACPSGSQFFAWGGDGGCVQPGTNKVVVKCFNMGKVCPSGWSNQGASDTGSWCCPQPATFGAPGEGLLLCAMEAVRPANMWWNGLTEPQTLITEASARRAVRAARPIVALDQRDTDRHRKPVLPSTRDHGASVHLASDCSF